MKILTIAIPCYNSQDYMRKCVESALIGGEDVEILIVDDGSSDATASIADEYEKKYPTIIKAIHKENGGHGDAVNTGIANATGAYFKVVDSDDWLDEEAYKKILKILKKVVTEGHELDLLLSNYVYDKVGRKKKRVMRYRHALPANRIISWDTCRIKFNKFQYVLMHSVIYRTQLLKDCNLQLPKHTFYVDNIFLFKPMIHVKKLMYINVDLYHYYIGREGQSVNEQTMVKRIDQQLLINKTLIDFFSKNKDINKQMYKFLLQYLDMMMCVASIICIVSNDKEVLAKKKDLWKYLKDTDKVLYRQLRTTIFGIYMNLPTRVGRYISKVGYHFFQRIFGFN
ncbi:MAG: glycosyltransferase [Lachnospiraceae bacterium]|nr:glycosyltransferase [Lachnospiraceae bacterium]